MRQSLAFLTKAAIICGISLFALTATTGAFALGPVKLTWTQQQIPEYNWTPPPNKYVDVFGLLYTKDSGNCSGGCLWANARYEGNSEYGRTYLTTNIASPSWIGCDSAYITHIAGRFGRDKYETWPYTATTAYIPNGPVSGANGGVSDMSYNFGICNSNNNLNTTQTDEAAGFLRTSLKNAYYIKVDAITGDKIMVTNDGGTNWTETTPAILLTINGIDGAQITTGSPDTGKVFLATSGTLGGLYECGGGNYPACSTWTLVAFPGTSLNKVLYKYNYLQGSTGTQLLVVGTNSGAHIGKFNSAGAIQWSPAIVPQIGTLSPVSAPIITGIAADQNYIYISSYGYTPSPGLSKAEALKKYSPQNLMSSSCNQRSELLKGLTAGGVTVFTTQWDGVSANMNQLLDYDSSNFYSAAVLGVSLQLDPTTNYATRVFVPSLAPVCNQGGYSVGQFSGYNYAAPTGGVTPSIACYPSGTVVTYPYTCLGTDIGKVFYVYGGGATGVHGLVAATGTGTDPTFEWDSSVIKVLIGATGTGIGHGRANTDLIVTALNTAAPAAKACTDVTASVSGINYNDWFLPSGNFAELNQMWLNRTPIDGFTADADYWSSTEASSTTAWYQTFGSTSLLGIADKSKSKRVRCIRAF